MDGYRIILTLKVTVDSNQELTMKMHATLMTGKMDPVCYRTVCLRDTTNLHTGCDRRLSDITQDGGSRANTHGLTLAWDEFQTQSAENSPSHAPCVPSVTVSMDDMLTGSGSVGFPTNTSTAFQSLEKLLSSIPQSQLVFNSPIKEVSREYTHLSTTAGTGPNTSTPADDLDMTGDHSRMDNTHSRLDAPDITPHSSPSLQGHKTVEEDVTKKDSELNEETSSRSKLDEIAGSFGSNNQSTTPVPFEHVEVIDTQNSVRPHEEKEETVDDIKTGKVKESDFLSEFVQVMFEKDCDDSIGTSDAVKPSPNISMDDMPSPGRPLVSFLTSDPLLNTDVTTNQASNSNSLLCSPPKNSNLARVQEYLQSLPSPGRRDILPETPNSKILETLDTSNSTPGVTDDGNASQCSETQSVASRQSELSSLAGARRMGGGLFYGMTPATTENQAPVCPFPEDWQFNTIPESIENDDDLD